MSTASVNEVRLIGNLGGDPEFNTTTSGKSVATFSLATTYRRGEVEKTEWHRVVLWRALAERAEKQLRKGASIWVSGRLATRRWTDNNGVERWSTEVIAEHYQMLGPKKVSPDDASASGGPSRTTEQPKVGGPAPSDADFEDDTIPF